MSITQKLFFIYILCLLQLVKSAASDSNDNSGREQCKKEKHDCPASRPNCIDGYCVACREDIECPQFHECASGLCVEVQCHEEKPCADSDMMCDCDNKCKPIE